MSEAETLRRLGNEHSASEEAILCAAANELDAKDAEIAALRERVRLLEGARGLSLSTREHTTLYGYDACWTVFELSDYKAGDPAMEIGLRRDGRFDIVISAGKSDATIWDLQPQTLERIGNDLVALAKFALTGASDTTAPNAESSAAGEK